MVKSLIEKFAVMVKPLIEKFTVMRGAPRELWIIYITKILEMDHLQTSLRLTKRLPLKSSKPKTRKFDVLFPAPVLWCEKGTLELRSL